MRILCLPPWSVASHEFPSNSTYSHTFFFFSSFPTLLQSDPQDLLFKLYFKQGPIFCKLRFLFYRNLLILSFEFWVFFSFSENFAISERNRSLNIGSKYLNAADLQIFAYKKTFSFSLWHWNFDLCFEFANPWGFF